MSEQPENDTSRKGKTGHLNHEQFFDLVQWVASNGERLMKEKPTYKEAARQAAAALGVATISEDHTLKSAMKKAGIMWETSKSGVYRRFTKEDQNKMESRFRQLDADLATLRGLVHHLYRQLDARPPSGYTLPPQDLDRIRISDGGR